MNESTGAVFGPSGPTTIKGKGKAPPTAFTSRLVIHTLPETASTQQRMAAGLALMLSGTCPDADLGAWKAYLGTYVLIVTPSLRSLLPRDQFQISELSPVELNKMEEAYLALQTALGDGSIPVSDQHKREYVTSGLLPGLPLPNMALQWEEASGESVPKIIVSHFSIVLFIAGKKVDEADHSAITRARPLALKSKAHLEGTSSFLEGALRLSDHSHLALHYAWAELAVLRTVVFSEYAKFSHSDTDFTQDLIYTTMHLLRFSGMQHAKITYSLLASYSWIKEIPTLRAPLAAYAESVRILATYPKVLQPYVKLIYQDKVALFPRNQLEPLIACAVADAEETSPTLSDFYTSGDYAAVVDAFLALKAKKEAQGEGSEEEPFEQVGGVDETEPAEGE